MPISYRVDPERRIVHLRLSGTLSVDEVLQYRSEVRRDPAYSEHYDGLIDARFVSKEFSRADVRRLADITRLEHQGSGPSRRAVILQDVPKLGLMEVFQAYVRGNPVEYRVFQTVQEAERWLRSPAATPGGAHPAPPNSPSSSTTSREAAMAGGSERPREEAAPDGPKAPGPPPTGSEASQGATHGDSAVGRENPADGLADADEALGNRVGGYGSRPVDGTTPADGA